MPQVLQNAQSPRAVTDLPGVAALLKRLEYTFADADLLKLALTHRSYANENPQEVRSHNERLEFLGDAVLDFVISDQLMACYPDLPEGDLSKLRAGLVSEPALAEIASELRLGDAVLIGRGEELSGGRSKVSILSDALEAVLAAVYLDSRDRVGVDAVRELILRLFGERLEAPGNVPRLVDFKTELQETVQKRYKDTVRYAITQEVGPDHDKHFEAAVYFRGNELGRGTGRSKKQAEQAAARLALDTLKAAK